MCESANDGLRCLPQLGVFMYLSDDALRRIDEIWAGPRGETPRPTPGDREAATTTRGLGCERSRRDAHTHVTRNAIGVHGRRRAAAFHAGKRRPFMRVLVRRKFCVFPDAGARS